MASASHLALGFCLASSSPLEGHPFEPRDRGVPWNRASMAQPSLHHQRRSIGHRRAGRALISNSEVARGHRAAIESRVRRYDLVGLEQQSTVRLITISKYSRCAESGSRRRPRLSLHQRASPLSEVSGDDLFSRSGRHVTRIWSDKAYLPDGRYVGVIVGDRLIYRSTNRRPFAVFCCTDTIRSSLRQPWRYCGVGATSGRSRTNQEHSGCRSHVI